MSDWHDSPYLACCRQRAAEFRATGACSTPLVEPDNRHVEGRRNAWQFGSSGQAASRDLYYVDAARRAAAKVARAGAR